MFLAAVLLTTLVLHQTTGEDVKASTSEVALKAKGVEAKSIGDGYGYSNNGGYSNNDGYGNNVGYGNNGGYSSNVGYGGHGRSYGRGYGGRRDGGYGGSDRGHHGDQHRGQRHHRQEHKLVPIKIPYIDANGCRFAGEPVCSAAANRLSYAVCNLANENKNLWKRPTFTRSGDILCTVLLPITGGVMVSTDFCNNNKKLLKAAGFIQEKDEHDNKRFHQSSTFAVLFNPCFFIA